MFLGTHEPRLDEKGRLVLPAKFRDGLEKGVVITKGQDRSLVLWPMDAFSAYADRLREASRTDARVRSFLRVFFLLLLEFSLEFISCMTLFLMFYLSAFNSSPIIFLHE